MFPSINGYWLVINSSPSLSSTTAAGFRSLLSNTNIGQGAEAVRDVAEQLTRGRRSPIGAPRTAETASFLARTRIYTSGSAAAIISSIFPLHFISLIDIKIEITLPVFPIQKPQCLRLHVSLIIIQLGVARYTCVIGTHTKDYEICV